LPAGLCEQCSQAFASVGYAFRASSIRSTLSLPDPTKVKRMVIWLELVNRSLRSLT
jgi:hypothetical protein